MARALGIDYGMRRVGLAISDESGTIARALPTLTRRAGKRPPVHAILGLIREHDIDRVVIGLPLSLAGTETEWTAEVRAFGAAVQERGGLPVAFADERLTSVMAERAVRSLGLPRRERERKERIDAAAAVVILQAFLNRERNARTGSDAL